MRQALNLKSFVSHFARCNIKKAALTGDEMLLYSKVSKAGVFHGLSFLLKDPIQTSLSRMKCKSQRKKAVEMFGQIRNYMLLTNDDSDAQEQNKCVERIAAIGNSSVALKDELYLQLLKQTRGNSDHFQEKNAFKLWSVIASNIHCSQVCLLYLWDKKTFIL